MASIEYDHLEYMPLGTTLWLTSTDQNGNINHYSGTLHDTNGTTEKLQIKDHDGSIRTIEYKNVSETGEIADIQNANPPHIHDGENVSLVYWNNPHFYVVKGTVNKEKNKTVRITEKNGKHTYVNELWITAAAVISKEQQTKERLSEMTSEELWAELLQTNNKTLDQNIHEELSKRRN